MAVAATIVKKGVWGDRRAHSASLVFSGNYATGGEAVTASTFGLQYLEDVIVHGLAVDGSSTALLCSYNPTTGKIMCFEGVAAGTPFAEKTNAEAYVASATVRVTALGW